MYMCVSSSSSPCLNPWMQNHFLQTHFKKEFWSPKMQCAPPGLPRDCHHSPCSKQPGLCSPTRATLLGRAAGPASWEGPQATATFWSGSGVSSAPPELLPSAAEGCLTLQLGHSSLRWPCLWCEGSRGTDLQLVFLGCSRWAAHILPCLLPVSVGHPVHVFLPFAPILPLLCVPAKHCIWKGKKSQPG